MNQSTKEIGQPEEKLNSEQKANNQQVSPSIANAVLSAFQLKVNDVFLFRYNEESLKKGYSNHCFDGQLIVKQKESGELYLMDTYWASKYDKFRRWSDSKCKTISDAEKQGTLTFVCNLDEVEEIKEHDLQYYADEDLFNLSYQHGCYKFYVKRNGSGRSLDKMLQSIKEKIEDAKYRKKSAERDIERFTETLMKIESGDTTVYL